MRSLVCTCLLGMVSFLIPSSSLAQDWKEDSLLFYKIKYTDENAKELPKIRKVIKDFDTRFRKLAKIEPSLLKNCDITIEFHPSDSKSVRLGYVSLVGGMSGQKGKRGYRGVIRMPGPAAYTGQYGSSSGHPQDRKFFDKLVVHEIAPVYLQLIAVSAGSRFQGPNWFIQGVEEYVAVYHSTEYWKKKGHRVYFDRLKRKPNSLDADFGLNIQDPYNDGFLVITYLCEEYGEKALFDVLQSKEPTFGKKMAAATRVSFDEFSKRLMKWRMKKMAD